MIVVIDSLPADPIPSGIQVVPLCAGMQYFENMVEGFVTGYFRPGTAAARRQIRFNVPVEFGSGDTFREFIVR